MTMESRRWLIIVTLAVAGAELVPRDVSGDVEKRGFKGRLQPPPTARDLFRRSDSVILRLMFGGGGIAGGLQPGLIKSLRVTGTKREFPEWDGEGPPEPNEFLG